MHSRKATRPTVKKQVNCGSRPADSADEGFLRKVLPIFVAYATEVRSFDLGVTI